MGRPTQIVKKGKETLRKVKKPEKSNDNWQLGLLSAMKDPNLKVEEDDQVVVVKDKYPKAQFHYLVIPKEDISSLKALKPEHVGLLKHMHKVGKRLAKEQSDSTFKIGYHAHASLSPLHLHVISDDFHSPTLKTKKHWNSFTTEFFLPYADVYEELQAAGKVTIKSEDECRLLLRCALKCHKCKFTPDIMPQLKSHLRVKHLKTNTPEEKDE